jgi:hypothetical protein
MSPATAVCAVPSCAIRRLHSGAHAAAHPGRLHRRNVAVPQSEQWPTCALLALAAVFRGASLAASGFL